MPNIDKCVELISSHKFSYVPKIDKSTMNNTFI